MSEFVLTPTPGLDYGSLILSDGDRTLELVEDSDWNDGIHLVDFKPPLPVDEVTYAEGADSEGRRPVRSKPQNPMGTGLVRVVGEDAGNFWDHADNLQELAASAHRKARKALATLTYTPPNGVQVVYRLVTFRLAEMPHDAARRRRMEVPFEFECLPYGELEPVPVSPVSPSYATALLAADPALYLRLGAGGLTDLSGFGRHGTAQGGLTVGGAAGLLVDDADMATEFDGSNDYISTLYGTRRNLMRNPNAEADVANVTGEGASVLDREATALGFGDWEFRVVASGGAVLGIRQDSAAGTVTPGQTYTVAVKVLRADMAIRIEIRFLDSGGSSVGLDNNPAAVGWNAQTLVAPANSSHARARIYSAASASAAQEIHVDGWMLEQAASLSESDYFDGAGYVSGGSYILDPGDEVGWLGTAHASASDKGVFANGTARTFMGIARRDTSASWDVLLAGSSAYPTPVIQLGNGTNTVHLDLGAVEVTWAGAWPGNGITTAWAIVFDEPNNAASLYINGMLVSTQTFASQYAPSGMLAIGAYAGGTEPFDGVMDEVAVFERALTAAEILDLYAIGTRITFLSGPVDSFEIENISGHVDAFGELTYTDASGQSADHIEIGLEQEGYDPASPSQIILSESELVITGFAGANATISGSHATNTKRATLTTTPVVVCSTGPQPHIGRKKIRARVYASADGVYVRLAWRVGDGKFTRSPWRLVPHASDFYDVALDVINLAEVPSGTHSWEGRIEAYAAVAGATLAVDFVEVFPAEVYALARTPLLLEPASVFTARDEFDQSSGDVAGKTLPVGGTWSGDGDANDFTVNSSSDVLERTAVSDSVVFAGRYARAGSGVLAGAAVQLDVRVAATGLYQGVFLRYIDTVNWLAAFYDANDPFTIQVYKRVAANMTLLAQSASLGSRSPAGIGVEYWRTIRLVADAAGNVYVYDAPRGGVLELAAVGSDSALAAGGTLDDGGYGILDYHPGATASERRYDNFAVWEPSIDHALFSGQSATLKHDCYLRENSAGTREGKLSIEGRHLRIPPATRAGLTSRLVVKRRRFDSDGGMPDEGLSDAMTADLTVTPRVLLSGA